jgi:t-SNARE complex subunit (syntaxin)
MENRQQQILSEIKEMMSSIRVQLEQLDAKMAELQYEVQVEQSGCGEEVHDAVHWQLYRVWNDAQCGAL